MDYPVQCTYDHGPVEVARHEMQQRGRGGSMGVRRGEKPGKALTVPQVCHELNVSRVTVYGLIDSGELPSFRVGKNYRIEPEDLEHYKRQGKAQVRASGIGGAMTDHGPGSEEEPA